MIISGRDLVAQLKPNVKEVSIDKLKDAMNSDAIVIDIREPGETALGIIPQAAAIPRGVLEMNITDHPSAKDKDTPLEYLASKDIYLYCRSGARSILAADSLQKMGFKDVFSVAGGFNAWKEAGYDIEKN